MIDQDLIYLLSCAVNGEKPDAGRCAVMDLTKILQLARLHSVTVAAATALEKAIPLPPDFMEEKYKAIRRFSLFEVERAKILHELEQNKIWYLPLKGIVMANDYPQKNMREMADNDILYDAARQDDVQNIMERLGFICKLKDANHHDLYRKGKLLLFEMHHSLLDKNAYPESYAYYSEIKERLVPASGSDYGFRMTEEDFYIFMIVHTYKHYIRCGTGLRSLLDVYVFLQKHGETLDRTYIRGELCKLQLLSYEQQISSLSVKVFTRQSLSEEEQRLLAFYIESNAYGTRENLMTRQLGNDDSAEAKLKYALKRIFPTGQELKINHPETARHKVLYPFMVVYRPVKGMIKKRKLMFGEIKQLKNFHKKELPEHSPDRKESK